MEPKTLLVVGSILLIFIVAILRSQHIRPRFLDEEDWMGEEAAVNY